MLTPIENRMSFGLADLTKRSCFKPPYPIGRVGWKLASGHRFYVEAWIVFKNDDPQQQEAGLTLSYYRHEERVRQSFRLEQVSSNLGLNGGVWYLTCPQTGRRCRTLYYNSSTRSFITRHAEGGLRYRAQLESRKWREMFKF